MIPDQYSTSSTALRVLRVLEFVGSIESAVTVAKVAAATDLDHATAYRALMTLHNGGYLNRNSDNKTFYLSWKIVSIAKHLLSKAPELTLIRELLQQLVNDTGETCHYVQRDGHDTVLLMHVPGSELVTVNGKVGDRAKLYYTAVGRAILAYQSDKFVEEVCGKPWPPLTDHTVTNLKDLRQRLTQIKETQISYDHGEIVTDMKSVASPIIYSNNNVNSGFSISGPASRFTDEYMQELGKKLRKAATSVAANTQSTLY